MLWMAGILLHISPHFTFDIHPGPFGYSRTTCDNSVQKAPVLGILWYIQSEYDIFIWGDNVKSKKLHDYVLKKSANFKVKVDKNWVRRGSRG
jgi:hypothetical protein